LEVIAAIGQEVRELPQLEPSTIEAVILRHLDVKALRREHLAGSAT